MAEKKDEDDNPFSFKTFVSVKEKKAPTTIPISKIGDDIFSMDTDIDNDGNNLVTGPSKGERIRENHSSATGILIGYIMYIVTFFLGGGGGGVSIL